MGASRALSAPPPGRGPGSSEGAEPTSFAFTAHLLEAGIDAYRTELIKPRRPWHGLADVELGTAEWVDWFKSHRLHSAIGDIPPHEYETNHYAHHQSQPAAGVNA
ncbi:integrase core domain-containing protein [Streptomyces sp. TRM72054]|uniref:integrase core domain-containing protein n=1 Tax=Streptomyces sp. TRM72054 TaxID=2870562 RepID=UPI001C8CCC40|nr:integrase core domain-containing protein [Streptomyces sp. TRM72054]